jgi:TPR repeat protein
VPEPLSPVNARAGSWHDAHDVPAGSESRVSKKIWRPTSIQADSALSLAEAVRAAAPVAQQARTALDLTNDEARMTRLNTPRWRKESIIAQVMTGCSAFALALLLSTPARAQDDAARTAFEREDYAQAATLYRPRAEKGDAEAQYRLGMMTRFGWGVEKDAAAAARWLQRAAENGHALAQSELGTMYRLGRGVPEDAEIAARWLRSAALGGVGIAQLAIGRMYRDGTGVSRDLVEAYAWFTAAGDNGVMDGFAYRSEIVPLMTAEQVDDGKRLAARVGRKEQTR